MENTALKIKYSKNVTNFKVQNAEESCLVSNNIRSHSTNLGTACNIDESYTLRDATKLQRKDLEIDDHQENFLRKDQHYNKENLETDGQQENSLNQERHNHQHIDLQRELEFQETTVLKQNAQILELNKCIQNLEKLNDVKHQQLCQIKKLFLRKDCSFDELYQVLRKIKVELDEKDISLKGKQTQTNMDVQETVELKTSLESANSMVQELENCLSLESAKNVRTAKEFTCAIQNVNLIRNDLIGQLQIISETTDSFLDTCSRCSDTILRIV